MGGAEGADEFVHLAAEDGVGLFEKRGEIGVVRFTKADGNTRFRSFGGVSGDRGLQSGQIRRGNAVIFDGRHIFARPVVDILTSRCESVVAGLKEFGVIKIDFLFERLVARDGSKREDEPGHIRRKFGESLFGIAFADRDAFERRIGQLLGRGDLRDNRLELVKCRLECGDLRDNAGVFVAMLFDRPVHRKF